MTERGHRFGRRQFLGWTIAGSLTPRSLLAGGSLELSGWQEASATNRSFSNATVLTHEGKVHEGWGVRVEDGLIVELGPGLKTGEDLGGAWLVPGLTDAGCRVGLLEVGLESGTRDDGDPGDAVTPDARVWDAYNPLSKVIPVTRVSGITNVLVHPSGGRLVTGQAALFHTVGFTRSEAIHQVPVGLCINLGRSGMSESPSGPRSRMGLARQLRELLDELEVDEVDEPTARRVGEG